MKNSTVKFIFTLLIVTFSIIWVSDKLSVLVEKEKYSYFETTEKSETENQNENKIKTLYLDQIAILDLDQFSTIENQNDSLYVFNVKEFSFESLTPPPELA